MGHIVPVFLAFLLNCSGVYIFTRPHGYDCLPYMSYIIFILSIFFLLLDCCLIPTTFRKLYCWARLIIEFAVAVMIMEFITSNLWFPLERAFLTFLPKIPQYMEELMLTFGYRCTGLCTVFGILRWQGTLLLANYLLSIFFFVWLTHATCVLDFFLLLACWGNAFIVDITEWGKQCFENMVRSISSDSKCKKKAAFGTEIKVRDGSTKRGPCGSSALEENNPDWSKDPSHYADTFDSDDYTTDFRSLVICTD